MKTSPPPQCAGAQLDELCWGPTAAEVLAAYHRGDENVRAIAKRHGVTVETVLALVDEAGYARHSQMRAAKGGFSIGRRP